MSTQNFTHFATRLLLSVFILVLVFLSSTCLHATETVSYPIRDGLIRDLTSRVHDTSAPDFPQFRMRVLDKTNSSDAMVFDYTQKLLSNPAEYVTDYTGTVPYSKNNKPIADMWIFKVDFTNVTGDQMILDPWQYRKDTGVSYRILEWTLWLQSTGYPYNYEDFAVLYLDLNPQYETDATTGSVDLRPIGFSVGESGEYLNDLTMTTDNGGFNQYSRTITFDDQWPMWYALVYFGDDAENGAYTETTTAPVKDMSRYVYYGIIGVVLAGAICGGFFILKRMGRNQGSDA